MSKNIEKIIDEISLKLQNEVREKWYSKPSNLITDPVMAKGFSKLWIITFAAELKQALKNG